MAPSSPSDGPGLRERKKRATREKLQRTALELAVSSGLDVTVEEICHHAEVSPRTFFNYFSCKDEAIVGPPPAAPSDDLLAEFESGGPTGHLLDDLRHAIVAHLDGALPTREQMHLRRRLLREHPELGMHHFQGFVQMELRFAQAAARRLGIDESDPRSDAVAALATGMIRLSVRRWVNGGDRDVADHAADVLAALEHVLGDRDAH